ncbi:MAG: hypothetical protein Q9227_008070 [Pyrenula ochraceoflavens]
MGVKAHRKQRSKWRAQNAQSKGKIAASRSGIESGDKGIFVTCDRGREMKCIYEMADLLNEYCDMFHNEENSPRQPTQDEIDGALSDEDVEASIGKEIVDMQLSSTAKETPFSYVKLDIECVSFMKLASHLDPVSIVHHFCAEAQSNPGRKRTRFVQRMTPMSLIRKKLPSGLDELCDIVLKTAFHHGAPPKKFAIRPTVRHSHDLDRDKVIKTVASSIMTGEKHTVSLEDYDALVLNVCGMSVVGSDYDKLKKYNLAEIYQPSQAADKAVSTGLS